MAESDAGALKREVVALIGLVLLADALFIGGYVLVHLPERSDSVRLGFTALWTLVTLAIALRSLTRIRAARLRGRSGP